MNTFIKYIAILAVGTFALQSCSNNQLTGINKDIKTTETAFEVADLLPRAENLSQEEFLQIQKKYNTLKSDYNSDQSNMESLIKIAEIYIYEARVSGEHPHYYGAALKTLNEVLRNKSNLNKDQQFTALFYKSTVQLSQHKFAEALETGNTALKLNDLNAGIYGVLVDANVELGNYADAIALCDKMVEIRPDLRSYSRQSYIREIHGDVMGSKRAMLNAINAGAPYSEYKCWSLCTLGGIYESEGELDSANICYQYATQERENYPFGIAGMARVMRKKGETQEAITLYKKALEVLPEIGFNIELAGIYKEQNADEKVAKMAAAIAEMFEEDIASGHNMALEYAAFESNFNQDYKKALKYAEKEAEVRPKNIDVNKALASIHYKLGNTKDALRFIQIACATGKKDADLACIEGLIRGDQAMVKASFIHNPFQDHLLANEGKSMIQ
jgi:tetratricopeptide (TPR) repeat protein